MIAVPVVYTRRLRGHVLARASTRDAAAAEP
jgi:hypothetical protein